MPTIIILLTFVAFLLVYIKIKSDINITAFHISSLIIILAIGFFILLIISFPSISNNAASSGINLWFNIVFPSLLPFFICSELLIGLGFVDFIGTLLEPLMRKMFNVPGSGAFAVVMGFTSGYPTGAKIVTNIRQKGLCTKTEGERLLAFTNNSGPLFILGAVAVGMFGNPKIGIILLISQYLTALTIGILFRFYKRHEITKENQEYSNLFRKAFRELFNARRKNGTSIGLLLGNSVKNSMNTLFIIGGFIIFFSVVISLLNQLGIISTLTSFFVILLNPLGIDKQIISSVICGIFEITTGCKYASEIDASLMCKLITTSLVIGWAGLSVHLQVISIISKTDINPKPYIVAKAMQSIISGIFTYLIYKYIINIKSITVFNPAAIKSSSWVQYFIGSSEILLVILLIFVVLSIMFLLFDFLYQKR